MKVPRELPLLLGCVAVLGIAGAAAMFSVSVGHPSVILFAILGVDSAAALALALHWLLNARRRRR